MESRSIGRFDATYLPSGKPVTKQLLAIVA